MGVLKKDETNISVIQRHSVADQVYFDLRTKILSGQIAQGERIVEASIAKSLGISRAPVREAVNRLTEAGLLESRTHYGTSVIQMSTETIRELYAVRNAIEALAIRGVAERHTSEDMKSLRDLIKTMSGFAGSGDLPGLVDAELEFHEVLWRMAKNPYIEKVAGLLFDHLRLALTVDNAGYKNLMDVAQEHEPLVKAIESGDPDKAAAALTEHIMTSLEAHASAK
ncbi:GntR family transcriptional regulator [Rhizobium leguminosarum]|uniref:GntR family transcriptional regulator n=1 Tax=Rhizobium leguminosarum TaxID=384 RepID=UPI001C8FFAC6|nr:GntR family transcriptional regulator [Rhizobium leguminosarum]MBY2915394.1 GntR family transcriptional regulator [Rhizobium leguminosarum]MBY2970932.1 GntR family transcriptional regulator [Rhizobium leguminosarum]MBY2977999.1 GntR family transcriptional regulator [Rhizobium leguminosarum]MBY3006549.1 GntR family transcriptional regulator [Rhizobium leguminosarum]